MTNSGPQLHPTVCRIMLHITGPTSAYCTIHGQKRGGACAVLPQLPT